MFNRTEMAISIVRGRLIEQFDLGEINLIITYETYASIQMLFFKDSQLLITLFVLYILIKYCGRGKFKVACNLQITLWRK